MSRRQRPATIPLSDHAAAGELDRLRWARVLAFLALILCIGILGAVGMATNKGWGGATAVVIWGVAWLATIAAYLTWIVTDMRIERGPSWICPGGFAVARSWLAPVPRRNQRRRRALHLHGDLPCRCRVRISVCRHRHGDHVRHQAVLNEIVSRRFARRRSRRRASAPRRLLRTAAPRRCVVRAAR